MRYIDKTTRPLSQPSHTVSTTKTQKIDRERKILCGGNISHQYTHTYIHIYIIIYTQRIMICTTNKFIMMCVITFGDKTTRPLSKQLQLPSHTVSTTKTQKIDRDRERKILCGENISHQ